MNQRLRPKTRLITKIVGLKSSKLILRMNFDIVISFVLIICFVFVSCVAGFMIILEVNYYHHNNNLFVIYVSHMFLICFEIRR